MPRGWPGRPGRWGAEQALGLGAGIGATGIPVAVDLDRAEAGGGDVLEQPRLVPDGEGELPVAASRAADRAVAPGEPRRGGVAGQQVVVVLHRARRRLLRVGHDGQLEHGASRANGVGDPLAEGSELALLGSQGRVLRGDVGAGLVEHPDGEDDGRHHPAGAAPPSAAEPAHPQADGDQPEQREEDDEARPGADLGGEEQCDHGAQAAAGVERQADEGERSQQAPRRRDPAPEREGGEGDPEDRRDPDRGPRCRERAVRRSRVPRRRTRRTGSAARRRGVRTTGGSAR